MFVQVKSSPFSHKRLEASSYNAADDMKTVPKTRRVVLSLTESLAVFSQDAMLMYRRAIIVGSFISFAIVAFTPKNVRWNSSHAIFSYIALNFAMSLQSRACKSFCPKSEFITFLLILFLLFLMILCLLFSLLGPWLIGNDLVFQLFASVTWQMIGLQPHLMEWIIRQERLLLSLTIHQSCLVLGYVIGIAQFVLYRQLQVQWTAVVIGLDWSFVFFGIASTLLFISLWNQPLKRDRIKRIRKERVARNIIFVIKKKSSTFVEEVIEDTQHLRCKDGEVSYLTVLEEIKRWARSVYQARSRLNILEGIADETDKIDVVLEIEKIQELLYNSIRYDDKGQDCGISESILNAGHFLAYVLLTYGSGFGMFLPIFDISFNPTQKLVYNLSCYGVLLMCVMSIAITILSTVLTYHRLITVVFILQFFGLFMMFPITPTFGIVQASVGLMFVLQGTISYMMISAVELAIHWKNVFEYQYGERIWTVLVFTVSIAEALFVKWVIHSLGTLQYGYFFLPALAVVGTCYTPMTIYNLTSVCKESMPAESNSGQGLHYH